MHIRSVTVRPVLRLAAGLAMGLAAAALVGTAFMADARADEKRPRRSFSPYVSASGAISLPKDYRARWVHLGSWAVPDEKGDGHGFHDVYAQPRAVAAYRKSGAFPDGAVLIKEVRPIHGERLTTGRLHRAAGQPKIWFVMVKDAKGRFAGKPNWGDGWGWALFTAKSPTKNVSKDYKADCLGCHRPARKTDWVYVQGYPTLQTR